MKCPITNTFFKKKFQNMHGLDGQLLDRLERVCPMLHIWRKEIDCPEFWRVYELGFWSGFQFMQAKEKKRHYVDVNRISEDIRKLRELTGLEINEEEIPEDLWIEVPKSE